MKKYVGVRRVIVDRHIPCWSYKVYLLKSGLDLIFGLSRTQAYNLAKWINTGKQAHRRHK